LLAVGPVEICHGSKAALVSDVDRSQLRSVE
jgi:hypothetical protein